MSVIFNNSLGWNENPAIESHLLDPWIVRENIGNNVRVTSPSVPKNKNGAVRFINDNGKNFPIKRAIMPTQRPSNWRFIKKSDVPNGSSAYTELEEYTNKQPIKISVVTIVRNTRKSAYKSNFFEIIFSPLILSLSKDLINLLI